MPDANDTPTGPLEPVPGRFGIGDELPPPGPPTPPPPGEHRAGGAHRRDPGDSGGERRWPWLVSLSVLAVLGLSGVIWLVVSFPVPSSLRGSAPSAGSSDLLSTPAQTQTAAAPPAAVDPANPTGTPPSASLTPSPTPSTSPTPSPTPRPTATPSRSPTPTTVQVPNVVGKRQNAAEAMLDSAGFTVVVNTVTTTSRRDVGKVLSQAPASGQTVQRGSSVTIVVGASA